jgi:hypothetical protein
MKPYEASIRRVAPLVVLAVTLAACGDSTGVVPDYDPERTLDHLDELLVGIDPYEDASLGISLAVATVEAYDASAFLARAQAPDRAPGETLLAVARSVRNGAFAAGADGAGLAALTLPSAIRGETLVWDPVDGYVVDPSRTDAPSNGVRFVFYRMDSFSGYPVEPLSEIGYIDILDEDLSRSERVGVRAVDGTAGGGVVADYYVDLSGSGTSSEGYLTLAMEGSVGPGSRAVDFDVTQRYDWSQSQDRDELTFGYAFQTGQRSLEVEGFATSRFETYPWEELELTATFLGASPMVEIGVIVRDSGQLDGEIRSDNRTAIVVSGTDGNPTFSRPDDQPLSQADVYTLEQVWIGLTDVITLTEWHLGPVDLLWLDG